MSVEIGFLGFLSVRPFFGIRHEKLSPFKMNTFGVSTDAIFNTLKKCAKNEPVERKEQKKSETIGLSKGSCLLMAHCRDRYRYASMLKGSYFILR